MVLLLSYFLILWQSVTLNDGESKFFIFTLMQRRIKALPMRFLGRIKPKVFRYLNQKFLGI